MAVFLGYRRNGPGAGDPPRSGATVTAHAALQDCHLERGARPGAGWGAGQQRRLGRRALRREPLGALRALPAPGRADVRRPHRRRQPHLRVARLGLCLPHRGVELRQRRAAGQVLVLAGRRRPAGGPRRDPGLGEGAPPALRPGLLPGQLPGPPRRAGRTPCRPYPPPGQRGARVSGPSRTGHVDGRAPHRVAQLGRHPVHDRPARPAPPPRRRARRHRGARRPQRGPAVCVWRSRCW